MMKDRFEDNSGEALQGGSRDHDAPESIPDALIDAFFDEELPREKSAAFFAALRRDGRAARDVAWTQRALDALRRPVRSPDLTRAVLSKVGRKRGWVSESDRLWIRVARYSVAAVVLLTVAGVFVIERVLPRSAIMGDEAALTELAASMPDDAQRVGAAIGAMGLVQTGLPVQPEVYTQVSEVRSPFRGATDGLWTNMHDVRVRQARVVPVTYSSAQRADTVLALPLSKLVPGESLGESAAIVQTSGR